MNAGPAPITHIGVPQQVEMVGNMPSTVYFSNQMQPVPYSQYQSTPAYAGPNSLWIKGITNWTQYAVVPQGATVSLLAITSTEGSGTLNLVDSDGRTYNYNYFFYPYSTLNFYADSLGRHVLSFAINGKTSNQVTIDVSGTYTPPSNYLPPINSYPTGYYGNYPGYYDPQAALDLADAAKAYQKLYGDYYFGSYPGNWYYGAYSWLNMP